MTVLLFTLSDSGQHCCMHKTAFEPASGTRAVVLATVTRVLVIPRLNCRNALYVGQLLNIVWDLKLEVNAAVRTLMGANMSVHITSAVEQPQQLQIGS